MARESLGSVVAHDVIDVDESVILGEKSVKSPPDPLWLLLNRIGRFMVDQTAIFVGEIPHSSFETAYDVPNKPNRSLLEKVRSGLLRKASFGTRLHRVPQ